VDSTGDKEKIAELGRVILDDAWRATRQLLPSTGGLRGRSKRRCALSLRRRNLCSLRNGFIENHGGVIPWSSRREVYLRVTRCRDDVSPSPVVWSIGSNQLRRNMPSSFRSLRRRLEQKHCITFVRSIALQCSLYEILSKVLATRRGAILAGHPILRAQDGFLPGGDIRRRRLHYFLI
jgi:hypothetical protein